MNSIDAILEYIHESNDFVVTSHVNPDGDNIGSTLSMYHLLKKHNKNVYYVMNDKIPLNLEFLVENINIINSNQFKELNISKYNVITLDCGDSHRICIDEDVKNNCVKLINIDHHDSNTFYGDLNYIIKEGSSTSELVYNLIIRDEEICSHEIIDEDIATGLYTGLITDTGRLTYSNTHASSFEMAKQLLVRGAKIQKVIEKVFSSNSLNYYKLLGEALSTLQVTNTKVATMIVTQDMMKRNDIQFKDVDGLVEYVRDIKDVEIGILLKEKSPNEIKVSFRAKSYADVSRVSKAFDGGGHIKAAGCVIHDSIENARTRVLEEALKEV